jgi:hypothetical protein
MLKTSKSFINEIYLPDGSAQNFISGVQITFGEIGNRFIFENTKYVIFDKEVECEDKSITTRYFLSEIKILVK